MDKFKILPILLDFLFSIHYNRNMDKLYQFNDKFYYTIARCDRSLVGNKQLHPETLHSWSMDLNHKFLDWDCDRLWVVKKGSGHIVTTFSEFDVTEGHAYFIPASTIIKTHCDDYMEQYYINFVTQYKNLPLTSLYSFDFETDSFDLTLNLIQGIIKAFQRQTHTDYVFLNTAISTFLSLFIKEIKQQNFSVFTSTLKYIDHHLHEKLDIKSLAKAIGYTPEYFSSFFKSVFHVSPQQYIIEKRITLAKHLLLSTSLPIADISVACGYEDSLYFSRLFSKQTLCSPSQFRKIQTPSANALL